MYCTSSLSVDRLLPSPVSCRHVDLLCSMQRLRDGRSWSVFDPAGVPSLSDLVGTEFTAAYVECEAAGLAVRVYDIAVLWSAIVDSQRETGGPFLVFQDNINRAPPLAPLSLVSLTRLPRDFP